MELGEGEAGAEAGAAVDGAGGHVEDVDEATDTVVEPTASLLLQSQLNARGVTNHRVVYDTTGFSAGDAHSIQNVPAINSDMLAQWQAWLITRGVLP